MEGKSRSGSARRKPVSTLKVRLSFGKKSKAASSSDSEEFSDLENSLKPASPCNSDSESIPELPEGTVIVNPEPVREKRPKFHGPEFSKVSSTLGNLDVFNCTACNRQVNPNVKGAAKRHPDLGVLICKKCYSYYKSGEIAQDSDGLDEQCRWCSEGGKLMGCDYCHNAFCKQCILRNFGRAELSKVNGDDDTKWKCYICDSSQLLKLTAFCDDMMDKIEKQRQLEKTAANTPKSEKSSKKNMSLTNSNSKINSKPSPSNQTHVVPSIKIIPSCVEDVVCKLTGISKTFITMLEVMKTDLEIPYSMMSPFDVNKVDRKRLRYAGMLQKGLETYTSSIDRILSEQIESNDANNSQNDDIEIIETSAKTKQVKMNGCLETDSNDKSVRGENESLKLTLTQKRGKGKETIFTSSFKEKQKSPTKNIPAIVIGDNTDESGDDEADDLPVTIVRDVGSVASSVPTRDNLEDKIDLSQQNEVAQLELLQELADELSNEQQRDKLAERKDQDEMVGKGGTPQKNAIKKIQNTTKSSKDSDDLFDISDDDVVEVDNLRDEEDVQIDSDNDADKTVEVNKKGHVDVETSALDKKKAKNPDKVESDGSVSGGSGTKSIKRKESNKTKSAKKQKDTSSVNEESDSECDMKKSKKGQKENNKKSLTKKQSKSSSVKVDRNESEEDVSSSDLLMSCDDDFDDGSRKTRNRKNKRHSQRTKRTASASGSEDESKSLSLRRRGRGKKVEEKKKTTKKRGKSQSSDYDSDDELDKDIERLSRKPRLGRKAKSDRNKSETTDKKAGNLKEKSKGKKKASTSSSNDDDDDDDDDEDEDENSSNGGEKNDKIMEPMDENGEADDDENELAKKAILDDVQENSGENGDVNSSDTDASTKASTKKAGNKKEAKNSDAKKDEESDDSDDVVPAKKRAIQTKLLNAKLSESDSDIEKKKATQKLDKAKVDSLSSDSDFQSSKKSKKRKHSSSSSSEEDSDSDEDSESKSEEENSDDSSSKKKKKKKRKGSKKGKRGEKGKGGKGKKKLKRIKVPKDSSDEDGGSDSDQSGSEDGDEKSPKKGNRKEIRKIKSDKKLQDETKKAVKAEESRRKRVKEKQEKFNNIVQITDDNSPTKCPMTTQLILERDKESEEPIIEVNKKLVRKLKPHQVEAVQFMYDCCCESVKRLKKQPGSGCILAHCMGLGKTLSVVSFVHTMIKHYDLTNIGTCLVVCPLNTVLNWVHEWDMWLDEKDKLEIYEMAGVKGNNERMHYLEDWHKNGGIMIVGYEMYRSLSTGCRVKGKKMKKVFAETLVDPGPDMVVCDEGHILKNDQSSISKAMNMMKTRRRIVLTGTPLQNNLVEYHCMVSFVKPNLLGTRKEFLNRFVNPIVNGQCSDSTPHDVKIMKRRAHIIHEMLAGCVQRRDYSSLTKFLPPKMEYVILVRLTPMQITLYEKYLEVTGQAQEGQIISRGARLFSDYHNLMKIWTHPWVLKLAEIRDEAKRQYNDEDDLDDDGSDLDSFIDDEDDEEEEELSAQTDSDSGDSLLEKKKNKKGENSHSGGEGTSGGARRSTRSRNPVQSDGEEVVKDWKTRSRGGDGDGIDLDVSKALEDQGAPPVSSEWWAEFVKLEDAHKVELSGKLTLLFEILRLSEEIGDKVLVFSQSLLSLNIIEDFLDDVDQKNQEEGEAKRLQAELKKKEKLEKKKEEAENKMDTNENEGEKKDGDESDKKDDEKKESDDEDELPEAFGKSWTKGADYFRMDGSTSVQLRNAWSNHFNDPENYRARLFLISTRAGSLGINLVAANRVIIFDASWNPSHDIQSIFRVYRFGQTKPCYIYRLLAQGTMEEKIYERQVTKQSLAQRVVDEHQIDRHFTAADLQELYKFRPDRLDDPDKQDRPLLALPQDVLLAEVIKSQKDLVVTYHTHDSLLENKVDQELSEEDKKAAWEEYENEKKGISNRVQTGYPGNMGMGMGRGLLSPNNLMQIAQMVRAQYPNLPPEMFQAQVQSVLQRQIMMNQEIQNRQIEQQKMLEMERLRRIREQINQQQNQISQQQNRLLGQQMFNAGNIQNWRNPMLSQMQSMNQQQALGLKNSMPQKNLAMLQAELERATNRVGNKGGSNVGGRNKQTTNGTAGSSDPTKKPPVNNVIETIDLS
ncbi:transcriptional regulator ATRX-like [Gigantopelta aegis]|uniref:transcriptional regulator ATRX-like n=1 Tax=Gigantopelta aegis TaxID=1735272 RepID=UPI001B88A482|nr:transcriptional regulator ATRX-like [Gigantopelta aegis]